MKKIITILVCFLLSGFLFALDIDITSELKTGFYMEWKDFENEKSTHSRLFNNDDADGAEGRIRLGINLTGESFGIRTRFSQNEFVRGTGFFDENLIRISVNFAYAYLNTFDNQLKFSAGLLGESPWGTGGPYLDHRLEEVPFGPPVMGLRTEWNPNFIPGFSLGFVLNKADDSVPPDAKIVFGDLFLESVAGIAWEHEYFAFRFAYRFDRAVDSKAAIRNGDRYTFRVEARFLTLLLPYFSVWANGFGFGLNTEGKSVGIGAVPGYTQSWLYILYEPGQFSAGINTGYRDGFIQDEQLLEVNPFFYWNFFNNLISVGLMAGMEFGFNNGRAFKEEDGYDILYNSWFLEPKIKLNINSGFYVEIVYRYISNAFESLEIKKDNTTQWFNLRLVFSL